MRRGTRETKSVLARIRERRAKRQERKHEQPQRQRGPSYAMPRAPVTAPAPAEVLAGNSPTAWRIAGALGTTPRELAMVLDVPHECIDDMFKGSSGQSAIAAGHPAWSALGKLVDEQIGLLMGVRAELEGKRELDAKRLRQRMERSKL